MSVKKDEKLLIIHGYSDGPQSFKDLRDFFVREAGFKKANVFFLDYASMDDEATFKDFADKLEADYNRLFKKTERINVVCHSTGALVVRAWLVLRRIRQRELGLKLDCPVKRLLMLAPANFGSDLAKMGQSFLGKFRSTFFNSYSHKEDFLESGKHVLQGLEPASPFQWDLSEIDLHTEDYFSADKDGSLDSTCLPFVFAAGYNYADELQAKFVKARKKPGTDGTVRICGTSLNTRKCKVFFNKTNKPANITWREEIKFSAIPFAVFKGLNHGSILDVKHPDFKAQTGPKNLIIKALNVDSLDAYNQLFSEFNVISEKNYKASERNYKKKYQQFFFKVRDDTGLAVDDFYIDFYVRDQQGNTIRDLTEKFNEYENKFYKHSVDDSCRVLMLNYTNTRRMFNQLKKRKLMLVFDIEAVSSISNIRYEKSYFIVYDGQNKTEGISFLYPNTTTLVEVVLNRVQSDKLLSVKDSNLKTLSKVRNVRNKPSGTALLLDDN